MLKTVDTFYFSGFFDEKNSIYLFIINVYTVTFDQLNASLDTV